MFPIKIRINPKALEEFRHSEYGSYEDSHYDESHGYMILGRHKGMIEVRNQREADDIYARVCSGTFLSIRRRRRTGFSARKHMAPWPKAARHRGIASS
jgi:hypothetical protein